MPCAPKSRTTASSRTTSWAGSAAACWNASTRCPRRAPRLPSGRRSGKTMSLSGTDVLALIERTQTDTRNEIAGVSTRLARFTAELETLRQREIGVLSVLARIRMREIEGGALKAALDETGKRVKELLGQREGALAAVGEELAAAERQQTALEQQRAEHLAIVGADEKAVDAAEAAAQQALGADPNYRA